LIPWYIHVYNTAIVAVLVAIGYYFGIAWAIAALIVIVTVSIIINI